MEAARAAVARHTSRRGHSTDVEEIVKPAVTSETIKPHRHEVITEAVDREIHQHHHHTTVVPLTHTETIPTRHSHNIIPIKKVHHQHENEADTQRKLAEVAGHFRNRSITIPSTHSREQAPPVVGEHFHHHVHEIVQPLIYKEVIQRETVHTTVPIHEVHHVVSKHHPMSALPLKQFEEFLKFNNGRQPNVATHSHHEGAPRSYDSKLSTDFEKLGLLPNSRLTSNSRAPESLDTNSRLLQRKPTPPRTPGLSGGHNRHHGRNGMSPVSRGSNSSLSSASSMSSSAPSTPTSPSRRHNMLPHTTTTTTMGSTNDRNMAPMHTTTVSPIEATSSGPTNMTTRTGNTLTNTTIETHQSHPPNTMSHTQQPFSNNNGLGQQGLSNNSGMAHNNLSNNNGLAQNGLSNNTSPAQQNFSNNTFPAQQNRLPTTPPHKTVQANEPVRIADNDYSPRSSDEGNPNRRKSFMSRLTGSQNAASTRRF